MIQEALLCECTNTSATTQIDETQIAEAMFELKDVDGDILFWWHSHGDMKAFFSGTDNATIEQIGSQGACLATVFNRKGETHTGFYVKTDDLYPDVYTDDIELIVGEGPYSDEFYKELDVEFKKKFKEEKPYTPKQFGGPYKAPTLFTTGKEPTEITGLPIEYVNEPWVEIDEKAIFGWNLNLKKMSKKAKKEWKKMFMENYGHPCHHDEDLADFIMDMMHLLADEEEMKGGSFGIQ